MAYIYKIENQINHKVYIGKTEQVNPYRRWSEHQYEARKNNPRTLYKALNKYGIDNFTFEILTETNSPNEDEIKYIMFYDSFHNGYNETLGGDGKAYLELPELEVCKYYLITKSLTKTAEYFQHDRETIKQVLYKNNITLFTQSEVVRTNRNNKKAVAKLDKISEEIIEIYESISAAERATPNHNKHISDVCNGKRKTCAGFKWKFIEK